MRRTIRLLSVVVLAMATVLPASVQARATATPWTAGAPMLQARAGHTATLLPTGRVLVTGGMDEYGTVLASAELYNPWTNRWAPTAPMGEPRMWHAAVLLASGRVLVTGGWAPDQPTNSAEIYTPWTGSWSSASPMQMAQALHTATLLPTGEVLVLGSTTWELDDQPEIYTPWTDTWRLGPSLYPSSPCGGTTTTRLRSGRVLIAGGCGSWGGTNSVAFELDAFTNTLVSPSMMLGPGRQNHAASLLRNGKVLATGGYAVTADIYAGTELYDPATATWTESASMSYPRLGHTQTTLAGGRVLVVGAYGYLGDAAITAEVYSPWTDTWTVSPMLHARGGQHTATLLRNGRALVAGGIDEGGFAQANVELFDPAA